MDSHNNSAEILQPNQGNPIDPSQPMGTNWGNQSILLACTNCQARYFATDPSPARACPNCLSKTLLQVEERLTLEINYQPERIIPHKLTSNQLNQSVSEFARGIPYPPDDLTAANITHRLIPIYFPAWLIDARIDASWQGEMGFDYQVVSHQDRYDQNSGRWISNEITETRIRWEPRSGTLNREYENVPTPALENESVIRREIGDYSIQDSQEFSEELIPSQSYIAVPDRPKTDAWNEAVQELRKLAAIECQAAGSGDHTRNFKWDPQFSDQNWTLLLRPAYTSYYVDDEGKAQKIMIHGTTGRLRGQRKASVKKAQSQALTIFIIAAVTFLLGLIVGAVGLILPPALVIGGLLLLAGVFVGLSALIPIFRAWQFNQSQR